MSQENVEIVRAGYAAWNRQDLDQFLADVSPRVVFHTAGIFPSHDPVYHGHDGIRNFWQIFHDAWGGSTSRLRGSRISTTGCTP